jgi:hypothetical protein
VVLLSCQHSSPQRLPFSYRMLVPRDDEMLYIWTWEFG